MGKDAGAPPPPRESALGELARRLRAAVVALGRELATTESLALLLVTLVLVVRYHLGSPPGQRQLAGLWQWLAGYSELFRHVVWQKQVVAVLLQLLVPCLAIWLLHRRRLADYGLGRGELRLWLPLAAAIFVVQIVVVAGFLARDPAYLARYPSLPEARTGGTVFWIWESSRLLYMLSWEFLFRGYLLFALERRLGLLACAVQTVPFVLMHMVSGKPLSEIYFTIASGLLSGAFVLLVRSVWPVVLLHAAGAILLDILIVYGSR